MNNKDIYNVNRKVTNFGDFCKTCEEPKLKKIDRQTKPNSDDQQQHIGNFSQKFNPVTRKIDYMSPEEADDRLDDIEELEESKVNESKSSDFLEWLKDLKEEIENESAGSGSAWNHGRDELMSQIWKKAKKMLK